jgi:hypothetical protein
VQHVRLSLVAVCASIVLTACASGTEEPSRSTDAPAPSASASGSSTPTPTPTPSETTPSPEERAVPTVEVGITGDRVTPNAVVVDLSVGDPLRFEFETDRAGQLHVHSKPEQFVDFGAGRTVKEITIKTPGSVEVEEHDTSAVVAIIEVR